MKRVFADYVIQRQKHGDHDVFLVQYTGPWTSAAWIHFEVYGTRSERDAAWKKAFRTQADVVQALLHAGYDEYGNRIQP